MRARKFSYAPLALADLTEIHAYISETAGSVVADRVIGRIRQDIRRRRETPLLGAPRPDFGVGCRLLISGRHAVYYSVVRSTMTVLRILHTARDRDAIMRGVQEEAAPFAASA